MHGFRDSGVRSIYLAFPSDSSEQCSYTVPPFPPPPSQTPLSPPPQLYSLRSISPYTSSCASFCSTARRGTRTIVAALSTYYIRPITKITKCRSTTLVQAQARRNGVRGKIKFLPHLSENEGTSAGKCRYIRNDTTAPAAVGIALVSFGDHGE